MKFSFKLLILLWLGSMNFMFAQPSVNELLSVPFVDNLASSPDMGQIAWTFDMEGVQNIYYSNDKGSSYQQLSTYNEPDGQKITNLQFSPNGQWLVYTRGGELGGNWDREQPSNATSMPKPYQPEIRALRIKDKKDILLVKNPNDAQAAISPNNKDIAFIKNNKVWGVTLTDSGDPNPHQLIDSKGNFGSLSWSPDGSKLVFVSHRGSHSFVGIYRDPKTPIQWLDPNYTYDESPGWSPDGNAIVFVRRQFWNNPKNALLERQPRPWEIRTISINEESSKVVWKSSKTLNGSVPSTHGRYNLHWAANNRITFLSTEDNWPHLYSVSTEGGEPLLLTPGKFMTEHISLSPDKKKLIFSANAGPDKLDIDRRHIGIVSVDQADMKVLTPGEGLEVFPVFYDKDTFAYLGSDAFQPVLPEVRPFNNSEHTKGTVIGDKELSKNVFSEANFVKPKQVIYNAPDGTPIHAMLFEKPGGSKKPGIVSIHGGPMRQMTLGWNYSSYYATHYAINQWLVSQGFTVLWVNYRRGIGYGNEFHQPADAGDQGASEYQDILAGGQWLAKHDGVDENRIGVYGGSYGGYLTAMALAKNSDLFVAGVDISGVHNRLTGSLSREKEFEKHPDEEKAREVAYHSWPIAFVDQWTSPVLIIHGDDDRNVRFNQSVDLVNRLTDQGVEYETLVIPDDTHHWLYHENLLKVYNATTDFLVRKVKDK